MIDPVLSRAAVRALDRRTIQELGLPALVLMENAGRACADEVQRMLGRLTGRVPVLCGPGNNGGDGLVIARTLWNRGIEAPAVFVGSRPALEEGAEEVRTNLRLLRGLGHDVEVVEDVAAALALAPLLSGAALVVDALFGTGLTRAIEEPWRTVIRQVNAGTRPVLAVDVPSGLDADTGTVLGAAVRASATVTFVARKPGFTRGRGPELCGRVVVAEIGVPREWIEAAGRSG
jgi:NAD(P)H-hydrate epimerase